MITERQDREMSIAAITVGLMLFFGGVSLMLSYVATRTGLLFDGGGAAEQTALGAAEADTGRLP